MNSRTLTIVVALLLVVSPIAGAAGPIGVASAQTQDGFVGLPDSNVQEDLPVGANSSLRASDLEGSVMASDYADSLEVVVTTPDRASEYVNGSRVGGGSTNVALVFQDDTEHAGREVAVPADAVRETIGYLPQVVHGVHDSGESWTAPIEARNGMLFFEIPRFSSNSVTFSATTEINGELATDQSSWTYDIGDTDSVSNFDINVTGNTSTESETASGTFSNGDSLGLTVAGNTEPTGPNGQSDPQITLEGTEQTSNESLSTGAVSDGYSTTINVGGNQPTRNSEITLTGNSETTDRSLSGSQFGAGSSTESVSIGGTEEPTGSAGGEPAMVLSGYRASNSNAGGMTSVPNDDIPQGIRIPTPGDSVNEVEFTHDIDGGNGWYEVDFYVEKGDTTGSSSAGGTKVGGPKNIFDEGTETFTFSSIDTSNHDYITFWLAGTVNEGDAPMDASVTAYTPEPSGVEVSVDGSSNFVGHLGDGQSTTEPVDLKTSTSQVTVSSDSGRVDYDLSWTEESITRDPSVSIGGETVSHSGTLSAGETVTESVSYSPGSQSVDVTTSSHTVDVSTSWTEVTTTEDPAIDIDGDGSSEVSPTGLLASGDTKTYAAPAVGLDTDQLNVSTASGTSVILTTEWTERTKTPYPTVLVNEDETGGAGVGMLNDGETVSLPTNTSWVTDGTNDVTLQLGDGSLSGNAPTPLADLHYEHDSAAEVTTQYAANGWVERYNVSRTFPTDQQGATLTIPHSREVYEVRYVQTSVNGGSWTDVPAEDWTLEGTELRVALDDGDGDGQVEGGDTIAVRTSAYKVQSVDGKVTVVDPTAPGEPTLETEIRVDDRQPGFRVRVGGTRMGDRVHYAHQESWEDPADRVTIDASGGQALQLPNAEIGDTAQVTTVPVAPQLSSGDVSLRVAKPDGPTLQVSPGTDDLGANVDFRFLDVQAGENYGLYSASRSRYVDTADSENGTVTLTDDDSEETLVLQVTDGDGGGGDDSSSGSGGPSLWEESGPETTLQELGIVAAWVLFVLLLVAATARSSLEGRARWLLVGTVATGSGLLSIEVLRPGMVSSAVNSSLGEILPLAGLGAIGIVAYSVYQWWQARREEATTPDTSVELDLGRGD